MLCGIHQVFAMAGLAEAALENGLLIIEITLAVVAGVLGLSWWKKSIAAVIFSCVALLIVGLLLQPWTLFEPPSADPDDAYWSGQFRTITGVWVVLVLAAMAGLMALVRRQRQSARSIPERPV